jgi:CspA family cold shock protein
MQGTIVRKRTEGYGFIKPSDESKDVFFHASSVIEGTFDELDEGDLVSYEVEEGPKGPAATNVKKLGSAPANDNESAPAETEEAA